MSHTDKDLPYDVRALHSGRIKHDHSTGECVIGTYAEAYAVNRLRRTHGNFCPRYNYVAECVHNAERQHYQTKVDTARHTQKNNYAVHPDSVIAESNWSPQPVRSHSSQAMREMLEAGYVPNCDQTKTHLIDLREIDLHLIPGEKVSTEIKREGRGTYSYCLLLTPALLRVNYDKGIPCDYCDSHPYVTCHMEPDESYYGKHRYCSCYDNTAKERYGSRRQTRDEMVDLTKQYNTFGLIED